MALPFVLAGPILRRCEADRVLVWLATSRPTQLAGQVLRLDGSSAEHVGSGAARTARLGTNLFVHLAEVLPDADRFPPDTLLGYDLVASDDGRQRRLADLDLPGGLAAITYGDLPLPGFFVRESAGPLHLLHGSCRLLHGKGEDAFVTADEVIARHVHDLGERPAGLLLTGDQIYGDEVAGPLVGHLRALADVLCGPDDATSVPGTPPLGEFVVYGREQLVEQAAFTSSMGANHLLSFGEYAAMYLTAWNEGVWPAAFPPPAQAVPDGHRAKAATARLRHRYRTELAGLEVARRGLRSVRRVLANTPTAMIFDDHDVTDDWNLTQGWRDRVRASPTGRRVVANALAAFWGFQGWGNEPEVYGPDFVASLTGHLASGDDGDAFDRALWGFDRWSFGLATDPPTVLLDTRTQRAFDSPEGAARLIGPGERVRVAELIRGSGHAAGGPLVLVSPVPVWGLELQERRQKFLVGKVGPYEIDFEAWHSNLAGFVDAMRLFAEELGLRSCVLLSGDVHYGMTVDASFAIGDHRLSVAQLVSSSVKHGGALSRLGLDALGSAVTATHRRLGWDRPPELEGHAGLRRRVLSRAANTDAWDDDSPVFLAPRWARRLGVRRRPDYRESRRYVRPEERRASVLLGENNVGLVTVSQGEVVHRLLGRTAGRTRAWTARLPLGGGRGGGVSTPAGG